MNLLAHLDNQIMAVMPDALDKMRSVLASADFDFAKVQASYLAEKESIESASLNSEQPRLRTGSINASGFAVINIKGALFNKECLLDEIIAYYFGGTSYQDLMADIDAVANNPLIQAVAFFVHSPGGVVFGMNETANKIAALTAKKPTIGYAYGLAASAGYGLISGCGEIVADANAFVGSIGVVTQWVDYTGFYEKLGIAYEEVTSSNAPFKRLDIRKPEHRAILMKEIDGIESNFIKFVGKSRNLSPEIIKTDFGQGAVLSGNAAKSAGMIDVVGSWEDCLKMLQTKAKKANKLNAANTAEGEFNMSFKDKFKEFAAAAGFTVSEKETEIDASAEGNPPIETTATEQPPTADLEAEKARLASEREQLFVKQAKVFADGEVSANRLLPAERDSVEAAYLQALKDDASSPLASGSRAELLTVSITSRQPHYFTQEKISPDVNGKILKGDLSDEEKLDAEIEAQTTQYVSTVTPKANLTVVK